MIRLFAIAAAFSLLISAWGCSGTDAPKGGPEFEKYRSAIRDTHGIDIARFADKLTGGRADGKDIMKYRLDQMLMGIKIEREHTTDKMTALEITIDHLDEIPDYYTRLQKMEMEYEDSVRREKKK